MPRRAERSLARVVDLGRVAVEVEPRRFRDEVGAERAVAEPGIAVLAAERVELLPTCRGGSARPRRGRPASRPGRRPGSPTRTAGPPASLISAGIARRDPDPRPARRRERREADDVVLDDDVGRELVDDLGQARMDVHRAVDQGPPGRGDELAELLDGRLAEDRRRVADEVDPELAGDLVDLGRRPEPHQALLEALRLERPGERLLDDEHDPVAASAQDLADPDAVVRRPEGALGEEDDRPRVAHRRDSQAGSTRIAPSSRIGRPGHDDALDDPDAEVQRDRHERRQQDRGEHEIGPEAVLRQLHPDAEALGRADVLAEDRADDRVDDADPEAGEERRQRGRPAQLPERLAGRRAQRAHQVHRRRIDPAEPVEQRDRDREDT